MRLLLTTGALLGMWALLSGMFDPLHLGSGVVFSVLIALSAQRWRSSAVVPVGRLFAYAPWLALKMIQSNLHVARLVMSRRSAIAPRFVELHPGVSGEHALATLGCSITLTPGTVTVELDEQRALVHTLDDESMLLLESGKLQRRIRRVFPSTPAEASGEAAS